MTYRFRRHEQSALSAVRRIAREEVELARTELEDPDLPTDEKVHQLRKRAKRLRGLFRLMRPGFPGYNECNALVRDAAKTLSGLRDQGAMVETINKLERAAAKGDNLSDLAWARGNLTAGKSAAPDSDAALRSFETAMDDLSAMLASWSLTGNARALRAGLRNSVEKGRKSMKKFRKNPNSEALHNWRKRVKDNWYHARLLEKLLPGSMPKRAAIAKKLGEALGDHHDLCAFRDFAQSSETFSDDPKQLACLLRRIDTRQDQLHREALKLGGKLYGPKRRKITKGWRKAWSQTRRAT